MKMKILLASVFSGLLDAGAMAALPTWEENEQESRWGSPSPEWEVQEHNENLKNCFPVDFIMAQFDEALVFFKVDADTILMVLANNEGKDWAVVAASGEIGCMVVTK